MPRKKTLKRKIRNKISDLEHAQENHSSKKSIFGGLRLVLPGMTGNTTTSSLSAPSKASALHTTQWDNGELGFTHPLNMVETERTSSSWARWSAVDANTAENHRNQAPPQNVQRQTRKKNPQPHSIAVHDENTSRYIMAVNRGLRFSKIDPPAVEPPILRRPGLHDTMNNLVTKKLPAKEKCDKPGRISSAVQGIHPTPDTNDSDSNVNLENAFVPKLTEYEYYQQRSAHGGRLGIEERIDVFEPQIESQLHYVDDLESLPLRIIADDDSTTRDSNFAASTGKSTYAPSILTQSSVSDSHLSSIQFGVSWPLEQENLIGQRKLLTRGCPPTDAKLPPVYEHLPANVLKVNEASTIHLKPDQDEVFDRIENLPAQNTRTGAASGIFVIRSTLPRIEKPLVPSKNYYESIGLRKEARNDSLLSESTDKSSAKVAPMKKEQSETEEIDRLLAILESITHDTKVTKKLEGPGLVKHESCNFPPRHNSPRKVFPAPGSPKRVNDFSSEPSMSSDGTFAERLKKEAFAVFDDDLSNIIDNPYLSPSGMESLYSKSLSESPQHAVVQVDRQYDSPIKDESAHDTGSRALRVPGYFPVATIGESTEMANSNVCERNVQDPFQSADIFPKRNTGTIEKSEQESDFLSQRKVRTPLYAAMQDDSQHATETQILEPCVKAMVCDKDGYSQMPENLQRSRKVLSNGTQNISPARQSGGSKSLVSSTFDHDKITVKNPFRYLENGYEPDLKRLERVFKDSPQQCSRFDSQEPSPSFIENDRTRLPFSSKVPSSNVTVMSSPNIHDCEYHPSNCEQSSEAFNGLYDDSGNRIVRNEAPSPIVNSLTKSNSKETKPSFDVYDQNTSATSRNIRVLQRDAFPRFKANDHYINEVSNLQSSSSEEKSTLLRSMTEQHKQEASAPQKKTTSYVIEKQGYASSPIRNYWREYSNVRVGGSFDSMSLKNGRSEESTVCGAVSKHSSFLNSTSEENCSYVDKCDNRNCKKINPESNAETTVPNNRNFQSLVSANHSLNTRNASHLETYRDGSFRKVRSFNHPSPLKFHEYSHAEKIIVSTPIENCNFSHENINSPETEFMNFSSASERATKEYNARVQRAISPVKHISENSRVSKAQISHAVSTDASYVTIHDERNTDDQKITPILRYKQYASDAANQNVLNGLDIVSSAKDDGMSLVKIKPQSNCSHDPIAHTKLPPRVQQVSGFVRTVLPADVRQSPILQNTCPSFDSDNAIADDLVEVLSVASSGEILGAETQTVRLNEKLSSDVDHSPLPTRTILPPWPPAIQNQFSDTVAGKESFEANSCVTEAKDVRDLVKRTILPKPDTRWKDSKQSVYSNDLPSPLHRSLINAMSPMLSGDTMDEDSLSEWSSRYDPSRAGGSEAGNVQCCSILSFFDFSILEEKLRDLCRFDNHAK